MRSLGINIIGMSHFKDIDKFDTPVAKAEFITEIGSHNMRILVVEDDQVIGDGLKSGLMLDGYATDWVESIQSAKSALKINSYELIVLDIGLPDGSGLDLLKQLREKGNSIPILVLTAYDDVNYKIKGLDLGADDYLIKPFKLDELKARLRALRRRSHGRITPCMVAKDVTLDPAAKTVKKGDQLVSLGAKEFAILQILMEKKGRVLSKSQIEDSLYGWDMEVESNTIEVHIHGIRKKLGKELIETVKYVGYRIQ